MIPSIPAWTLIFALPVVLVLPGYALVRLIETFKRSDLSLVEVGYLSVALSVVIASLTGLLFAIFGAFGIKRLIAVMLVLSVVLLALAFWRARKFAAERTREKRWYLIGLLVLLVLSAGLFIRGTEYIVVVREPARYMAWGDNIARHGGLHIYDRDIPGLTHDEVNALYGTTNTNNVIESGWSIKNYKTGELTIDYFPLYGAILAISFKLIGLKGTLLLLNPFLAMLGMFALVLALKRLLNWKVALIAGLLFTVNGLTIYFSRYVAPELFAMFTVFLGILLFAYYLRSGNGLWGIASAFAFATSFIARYDLYLILVPIVLVLALLVGLRIYRGERLRYLWWFAAPLPFLFAFSLGTQLKFSHPYFEAQYEGTLGTLKLVLLVAFVAVLSAGLMLAGYLLRRYRERLDGWSPVTLARRYWRIALGVLLVAGGLFAYFINPLGHNGIITQAPWTKDLFVQIFWYLTPIAFVVLLVGIYLFSKRGLKKETLLFFAIGMFFTLVLTYSSFCFPEHIWFMRRYIVVVVPFFLGIVAYGLVALPEGASWRWRRWLWPLSLLVLAGIVVMSGLYSAKIVPHVEFQGALSFVERTLSDYKPQTFYGKKEPDPVVLFQGDPVEKFYPLLLKHVFGMKAFPINVTEDNVPAIGSALKKWQDENRRVFMISSAQNNMPDLWPFAWMVFRERRPESLKYLEWTWDTRPENQIERNFPVTTFLLSPDVPADGYTVDVGGDAYQVIVYGLYEPELLNGQWFRWASNSAMFKLPALPGDGPMQVSLRVSPGSKFNYVPDDTLTVMVDGRLVGSTLIGRPGYETVTFQLDRSLLADPNERFFELTTSTPGWVPQLSGVSPDDNRVLGLQISTIQVQGDVNRLVPVQ